MTLLKETATLTPTTTGRARIGVITPGQGSSGIYPKETIEAAGRDKVFPAGTQMFWNHATETEDWNRPEGDLHNLVGVLTEDAHWDDTTGGLVAEAKIYSHWKQIVAEMAEDIGVSIRAAGEVREDGGQRIITRLTEARSVDFVTKAGRGGRILEVLESARAQEATTQEIRELLHSAVRAAHGGEHAYAYVRDFDTDKNVAWFDIEDEDGMRTYEQAYTISGVDVTLIGTPTEVVATTNYVPKTTPAPAGNGNQTSDNKEAAEMADTTDTSRVDEAGSKKNNGGGGGGNSGDSELERLRKENAELKAEIARLKAQKAKEARRTEVAGIVEEAFENIDIGLMKGILIDRLAESDADKDALIKEARTLAEDYKTKSAGDGHVRGLGESRPLDTGGTDTSINESALPSWDELAAVKGA